MRLAYLPVHSCPTYVFFSDFAIYLLIYAFVSWRLTGLPSLLLTICGLDVETQAFTPTCSKHIGGFMGFPILS